MKFVKTDFEDLYLIEHNLIEDDRGWFMRTFDIQIFNKKIPILNKEWKQVNQSHNSKKGTFRGLHFQKPPFGETKLIRCISGSVIDFALDLRKNSKTFLKVFEVELSAENKISLLLPKGFAHGFVSLEDSIFSYKCSNLYNKESEVSINPLDTDLNIDWKIDNPIISEKDLIGLSLKDFITPF